MHGRTTPADEIFLANAAGEVGSACVAFTSLASSPCERFHLGGVKSDSGVTWRTGCHPDSHETAGKQRPPSQQERAPSPRGHLEDSAGFDQDEDELDCASGLEQLAPGRLVVESSPAQQEASSDSVRTFNVGGVSVLRLRELDTARAGLGHAVWASGLALAAYIGAHPSEFSGRRLLELGGGVGLPGFTAACLKPPPAEVMLSDLSSLLVENMKHNMERNHASLTCSSVDAKVINWDDCARGACMRQHGCTKSDPRGGCHGQQAYDIIIGADVVYNPANAVSLSHAILAHLRDGGTFYMVCPSPSVTRPGYDTLVDRLRGAGTVTESAIVLEHSHTGQQTPNDDCSTVGDGCFRVFNFIIFQKRLLCLPAPSSMQ